MHETADSIAKSTQSHGDKDIPHYLYLSETVRKRPQKIYFLLGKNKGETIGRWGAGLHSSLRICQTMPPRETAWFPLAAYIDPVQTIKARSIFPSRNMEPGYGGRVTKRTQTVEPATSANSRNTLPQQRTEASWTLRTGKTTPRQCNGRLPPKQWPYLSLHPARQCGLFQAQPANRYLTAAKIRANNHLVCSFYRHKPLHLFTICYVSILFSYDKYLHEMLIISILKHKSPHFGGSLCKNTIWFFK